MAIGGGAAAAAAAAMHSSSYRVKFKRNEFLRLVEDIQPERIYHVRRMHFFAVDGFVMYTFECNNEDFRHTIYEAIEFSNYQWSETS
jgi:hypothetical protein